MVKEETEYYDRKVNRADVLGYWRTVEKEVSDYYKHVPDLLTAFPYEIAIPYVFSRLELAQIQALYCGLVKLHSADFKMARRAVDSLYRTRPGFEEKFRQITGSNLGVEPVWYLGEAAKIRDKVLHGIKFNRTECLFAVKGALVYSHFLHEFMVMRTGVSPFKTLRGFNWGVETMPSQRTKYMLMGMGFFKVNKHGT